MEYRIEAEVTEGRQLNLNDLPFEKGVKVKVTVSEVKSEVSRRYPLRGSLVKYDLPFATATDDQDWEATR